VGLLLLRGAVGITALVQGGAYLGDWSHQAFATVALGMLAVVSAASLLIGLFTPMAGILVALSSAVIALSWVPPPLHTSALLDDKLVTFLIAIVAAAIGLLGPGAFSLDAYLFGRREIIIPHDSRVSRSRVHSGEDEIGPRSD